MINSVEGLWHFQESFSMHIQACPKWQEWLLPGFLLYKSIIFTSAHGSQHVSHTRCNRRVTCRLSVNNLFLFLEEMDINGFFCRYIPFSSA